MIKNRSGILIVLALCAFQLLVFENAQAEESYDRYGSVLRTPTTQPGTFQKTAARALVYPFELVRWPIDQGLLAIEQYHIPEKAQWIYEKIQDQGITPEFSFSPTLSEGGAGADIDLMRLFRQKMAFPDFTLKNWIHYDHEEIFETGVRTGLEQIAGSPLRLFGNFNYENRPEEHFYGLGPDTSAGDGTSYRMEATTLQAEIGYSPDPSWGADFKFAYRNVNITNGEDGGRGIVDEIFRPQVIPGLGGDELLTYGLEFFRDTRNQHENSSRGGHARAGVSYNEGLGNSEARYFKYELDASRFFELGSERRVLALHAYGEHNSELDDHEVPFHQMAKLGGYGVFPRLSHTLRGYDNNRFFGESAALFNAEYRYRIWEYRDWKTDAVLFWDEGQVFRDLSNFQLKDFRESYGLGFRISLLEHVVICVEVAHGSEGTNFYLKSGAPF